jgi:hypothetical protein
MGRAAGRKERLSEKVRGLNARRAKVKEKLGKCLGSGVKL